MALVYKCPNCGQDMTFDSEKQALHCQHCNTQMSAQEMQADTTQEQETTTSDEVVNHHCPNCGANVLTDANTAATFCVFCGAPAIIPEKLSDEFAPDFVIPFSKTKDDAINAFKKWCKKGLVTPKGYFTPERIDKITGVYVPFFLYDCDTNIDLTAHCTNSHTTRSGDVETTHTKHYDVMRNINNLFEKIPCDASKEMDDDLMDKLEPFNFGDMQNFAMPYLSGYLAEKFSVSSTELQERVLKRAKKFAHDYAMSTITGYSTKTVVREDFTSNSIKSSYAMLPIWVANYDYKNKKYIFAMNGQTGKVVGKPPISILKSIGVGAAIFGILSILILIIGGLIL